MTGEIPPHSLAATWRFNVRCVISRYIRSEDAKHGAKDQAGQ